MIHEFRSDLFRGYLENKNNDFNNFKLSKKDKRFFEGLCLSFTTKLKEIITVYLESKGIRISEDICVTVKLAMQSSALLELYENSLREEDKRVLETNEGLWIVSAYRNVRDVRANREVGGRLYNVEKNTAFLNILRNDDSLFVSDDLEKLGSSYKNENPNWRNQYNATMVSPIRYRGSDNKPYCFGFIAVDCLNKDKKNVFDNNGMKDILGSASDLMAIFFLTSLIAQLSSDKAGSLPKTLENL